MTSITSVSGSFHEVEVMYNEQCMPCGWDEQSLEVTSGRMAHCGPVATADFVLESM